MSGRVGTAFAHDEGHIDALCCLVPAAQGLVVTSAPRVERHGADVPVSVLVGQGWVEEVECRCVAVVTQQHLGAQVVLGHLGTQGLDEVAVLLRGVQHVDADVGLVEREIVGLNTIFVLEEQQIGNDGIVATVQLCRIEAQGCHARPLGLRARLQCPRGREPAAHNHWHAYFLESCCHLGALDYMAVVLAALVPCGPGELDAAHRHAHVL